MVNNQQFFLPEQLRTIYQKHEVLVSLMLGNKTSKRHQVYWKSKPKEYCKLAGAFPEFHYIILFIYLFFGQHFSLIRYT